MGSAFQPRSEDHKGLISSSAPGSNLSLHFPFHQEDISPATSIQEPQSATFKALLIILEEKTSRKSFRKTGTGMFNCRFATLLSGERVEGLEYAQPAKTIAVIQEPLACSLGGGSVVI